SAEASAAPARSFSRRKLPDGRIELGPPRLGSLPPPAAAGVTATRKARGAARVRDSTVGTRRRRRRQAMALRRRACSRRRRTPSGRAAVVSHSVQPSVLVVDGDPKDLMALRELLQSWGQNVVLANSGDEALRCVLAEDFAVILLDARLPGVRGFATARL